MNYPERVRLQLLENKISELIKLVDARTQHLVPRPQPVPWEIEVTTNGLRRKFGGEATMPDALARVSFLVDQWLPSEKADAAAVRKEGADSQ